MNRLRCPIEETFENEVPMNGERERETNRKKWPISHIRIYMHVLVRKSHNGQTIKCAQKLDV